MPQITVAEGKWLQQTGSLTVRGQSRAKEYLCLVQELPPSLRIPVMDEVPLLTEF